jgi:GT2 family glycosyltransferase
MIDASVIIVNYRSENHVAELLAWLSQEPQERPAQILIVDNSPGRGLAAHPEIERPAVLYLPMEHNVGFAAAVNAGLLGADQRIAILLNPDARPEPGCLSGLLDELNTTPEAAIAGPRLTPFHEGEPEVPSATLIEPNLKTVLLEYTALYRLVPGSRDWLRRYYFAGLAESPVDTAMVQGACFALLRSWSERLGGFDPRFFLYWEETDFCRRVREQGGKVRYCPQLHCRHVGGASIQDEGKASRDYWRGFYTYLEIHRGKWYARGIRVLMMIGVGAEYLILRTIVLCRRGRDPQLAADTESLRLRLRGQFLKSAR